MITKIGTYTVSLNHTCLTDISIRKSIKSIDIENIAVPVCQFKTRQHVNIYGTVSLRLSVCDRVCIQFAYMLYAKQTITNCI